MEQQRKRQPQKIRAQRARSRRQKKQNKAGMMCIACIVGLLLLVMSTQILQMHQKNQEYKAQEKELTAQLSSEQERQKDLKEYGKYVKSKDYVEKIAKTKLGLVHSNEIIFKEKKTGQ